MFSCKTYCFSLTWSEKTPHPPPMHLHNSILSREGARVSSLLLSKSTFSCQIAVVLQWKRILLTRLQKLKTSVLYIAAFPGRMPYGDQSSLSTGTYSACMGTRLSCMQISLLLSPLKRWLLGYSVEGWRTWQTASSAQQHSLQLYLRRRWHQYNPPIMMSAETFARVMPEQQVYIGIRLAKTWEPVHDRYYYTHTACAIFYNVMYIWCGSITDGTVHIGWMHETRTSIWWTVFLTHCYPHAPATAVVSSGAYLSWCLGWWGTWGWSPRTRQSPHRSCTGNEPRTTPNPVPTPHGPWRRGGFMLKSLGSCQLTNQIHVIGNIQQNQIYFVKMCKGKVAKSNCIMLKQTWIGILQWAPRHHSLQCSSCWACPGSSCTPHPLQTPPFSPPSPQPTRLWRRNVCFTKMCGVISGFHLGRGDGTFIHPPPPPPPPPTHRHTHTQHKSLGDTSTPVVHPFHGRTKISDDNLWTWTS